MSPSLRLLEHGLRNLARSRWVLLYALFFGGLTETLIRFGGVGDGVVLTLTNVALLLVPLVSLVFGTMALYHARSFIELMLAQPVGRGALFTGLYAGLALPLALAFAGGTGLPLALHGAWGLSFGLLLAVGTLLTFTFTALAFLIALRFTDRAVGLGAAILVWLVTGVLYDGLVLLGITLFGNWPIERAVLGATLLNPVDLARVLLILRFDLAALSGYTGAVFTRFFSGGEGVVLSLGALILWAALPLAWGARRFARHDF